MYEYQARLVKVVDGDTYDLDIDLGFHIHVIQRCRLLGYNTAELRSPDIAERNAAVLAVRRVEALLADRDLTICTEFDGTDKYGRVLAAVYVGIEELGQLLYREGLAVPYDGVGKASALKVSGTPVESQPVARQSELSIPST